MYTHTPAYSAMCACFTIHHRSHLARGVCTFLVPFSRFVLPARLRKAGKEVVVPHKYSPPFNGSRCHFSRHIRERFRVFALESLLYLSHGSYLGEMLGQVYLAHPIDSCVTPPYQKQNKQ